MLSPDSALLFGDTPSLSNSLDVYIFDRFEVSIDLIVVVLGATIFCPALGREIRWSKGH